MDRIMGTIIQIFTDGVECICGWIRAALYMICPRGQQPTVRDDPEKMADWVLLEPVEEHDSYEEVIGDVGRPLCARSEQPAILTDSETDAIKEFDDEIMADLYSESDLEVIMV